MGLLRTAPTTKDSIGVADAIERDLDQTPFVLEHVVRGNVLYGLQQDIVTNGPIITKAISTAPDQDGKWQLLVRAANREEGALKLDGNTAAYGADAAGLVITKTVPARKIWKIKNTYMTWNGTATTTAFGLYLRDVGAVHSIRIWSVPTPTVALFSHLSSSDLGDLEIPAGWQILFNWEASANTNATGNMGFCYQEIDV